MLNVVIFGLNLDCGVIEMGYFSFQDKQERNYFNTGDFKQLKPVYGANNLIESEKKFIDSALI